MKNPFLKRLMKDTKSDVIHSSSYASAQNAGNIGAASTETFAQRKDIKQNRQMVNNYGTSRLVNDTRETIRRGTTEEARKVVEARAQSRFEEKNREANRQNLRERFSGQRIGGENKASTPPPARKNPGIFR